MPNHLTVVARLVAKPGKEDETRQTLLGLIEPTRQESGCVEYYLHEQTGKPGSFLFYENWTSEAALAQHMATPHLEALVARVPDLLAEPPEILTYGRIG